MLQFDPYEKYILYEDYVAVINRNQIIISDRNSVFNKIHSFSRELSGNHLEGILWMMKSTKQ